MGMIKELLKTLLSVFDDQASNSDANKPGPREHPHTLSSPKVVTLTSIDVEPSLQKLYAASEDKAEGVFWFDHIKTLRNDPEKRLAYALTMVPLPAAFREAAIAYRTLIKGKRKAKQDYAELIEGLYVLLAKEGFLFARPYIEEFKVPAFTVACLIPAELINSLPMPYKEIGYRQIPASPTDVKWFVEAWGEPERHTSAQEYHAAAWKDALDKYRINKRIQDEKFEIEMRSFLK